MQTPGVQPHRGAFDQDQDDAAFARAMRALLHPRRIAIVGASPKRGFANTIQRRLIDCGYEGEVFPVNPNYAEIMGLPCYPSLEAIPGGVDLAILVVPSGLVPGVLAACERAGVGAVNIITSGFAEKQEDATGPARQAAIRDFARRTGIRVVGPNCLGNISVPNRMVASSGAYPPLHRGPIALALQSGLLAYSLILPAHDRGIGFSYVVTLGNEADIDVVDMIRYYLDDEETRVIGCFVEQFRRPERLLEMAERAADLGKPIVVLKVGRSEAGRRAALAHTGSLVGADEIVDAVMRQHGIIRVFSLDEMIETLALFHSRRRPAGRGVGIAVVSGGAAGLIADLGEAVGIDFPPLAPETVAKMNAVIPPYGTVGNPLDYTGQAAQQPEILDGCLAAMAEDPNIHVVVYGQAYPALIDLEQPAGQVLRALPERYPDKVFVVLSLVAGELKHRMLDMEPVAPVGMIDGIPFLQGAENGLRALASFVRYAAFLRERAAASQAAGSAAADAERAAWARAMVQAAAGRPLVEREAKAILARYGIPVTREALATTAEEAVAAARAIGYPVALKIESPDITHKTEAGGVLLGVGDDAAVREGFARVVERARQYEPTAAIAGVLVQEMVPRGGHELILGMTQDPAFGPAVAVGLGGIFVETLKDVALAVPPIPPHEARAMLGRLRAAPVLSGQGARGQGPADLDAVVDIVVRFSQLCRDLRDDVAEIDINPLVAFRPGQGAWVVDCLIVPRAAG
ncbi:MAG: acetate--CoA ligase family protein [Sphaerobacter sp.]|nr:acetate--CoA ligase family protein [Sphaerobacter sp.]